MIVGVDGGGSKTDFVGADLCGNVLSRVVAAGSNPVDIGIESAAGVVMEGIGRLMRGYEMADIDSIYVGLSGGTTGKNKERVARALKTRFAPNTVFENGSDIVCALNSGVGLRDGAVVVAGTGCVGYARKNGGELRIDGYGYLISKGGSGFDIGRDAIYHALRSADGRGPRTVLLDRIEEKTGRLPDNLDIIYDGGKAYIAAFAPLVFEACRAGDAVAERILADNAHELAGLVNALAAFLAEETCGIVLCGGVFKEFELMEGLLAPKLARPCRFILPELPPVFGAVIQASSRIGVDDREAFCDQLKRSILVKEKAK